MEHFKFHIFYKQAFDELSIWNKKKLLYALIEYAENCTVPKFRNKKLMSNFNSIRKVIDSEKELIRKDRELRRIRSENGKKGARKRWNDDGKNGKKIAKDSKTIANDSKKMANDIQPFFKQTIVRTTTRYADEVRNILKKGEN